MKLKLFIINSTETISHFESEHQYDKRSEDVRSVVVICLDNTEINCDSNQKYSMTPSDAVKISVIKKVKNTRNLRSTQIEINKLRIIVNVLSNDLYSVYRNLFV